VVRSRRLFYVNQLAQTNQCGMEQWLLTTKPFINTPVLPTALKKASDLAQ
jgi:hypothetical protein